MTQIDTFGFDKARLVGVYQESCSKLEPLQLPLYIDDSLKMVLQFEDQVSRKCSHVERSETTNYDDFVKKFESLGEEELKQACAVQGKNLFVSLPQFIHCVGCRRSVEHLFQQVQKLNHSVYESLSITQHGTLVISSNYIRNPRRLYHLFYYVRPKLYDLLDSLMNSKKNKRCIFHSLKMQKPTDIPSDNKPSLPKWCSCSIMDVWDRMCRECHEEIATLDCKGVVETMDNYLKKHRFCNECKAKVQKAYHILIGEIDPKSEIGFCSALYEGLHCCKVKNDKKDGIKSKHIHVCPERSYIVHMLTQADTEIIGSKKERHAKTIDVAQEEVCTCLALHLYQRLHKVWHQKLIFEQTWLALFFLGIESIRQNFEMYVEGKIGVGMEALCKAIEQTDREKQQKLQRRRQRKQRQKQKKDQKSNGGEKPESACSNKIPAEKVSSIPEVQHGATAENGKFHLCLLDIFSNTEDCQCLDECSDDLETELTQEEILEFERNRTQINVQRSRLRERIRQDFENFCNIGSSNTADMQ